MQALSAADDTALLVAALEHLKLLKSLKLLGELAGDVGSTCFVCTEAKGHPASAPMVSALAKSAFGARSLTTLPPPPPLILAKAKGNSMSFSSMTLKIIVFF